VVIVSSFVAVGELQGAALSLVGSRVRVCGIVGKVETVRRRVAGAGVSGKDEPCLFLPRPGVEKLELGVRDATIVGIHRRRLRAVAVTDDLDEALAGVDLAAQEFAEVAGLGAEDFLNNGCVAQPCKDEGDAAACLAKLRRNAGDKDGRLVHGGVGALFACSPRLPEPKNSAN
jgi:hypothetical protein